jgi:KDO2-lipid IV(A) lauroyltransferase
VKIKLIIFLIGSIPISIRRAIAFFIAKLFYHLSLKHRLIAINNLMRSFPDKSLEEIIRITKESYKSVALVLVEFYDIPSLNKDNLDDLITVRGLDNYTTACNEGKGVLLFGAHFGNWEIGNAALGILTRPLSFVYRILDSRLLEGIITTVRASCGNTSLPKENAMRQMIRLLKKDTTVSLLIDQNVAWYGGVFVDFFGRKASTTSGLALLAMHTGAPVLPFFTSRQPDGNYLLEIGRKVNIIRSENREADILINTQNFTKVIEEHIRQYPEQWFWVHQRWKTKLWQAKQRG